MSDEKTLVIGSPEELGRVDTRRRFLRMLGIGGSLVLLPSVFAACDSDDTGVLAPPARGGTGGGAASGAVALNLSTDAGILNYAFALEQLEAAFYSAVVTSSVFASLSAEEQEIMTDLRDHEVIHREFLRAAIPANGGTLIGNLAVNFGSALSNRANILATARVFEDLGVAAYNGAGKYLTNATFLTLAGKIVSVEARHAAAIRDVLDTTGTAFANVSDIETSLGASQANGLDGAREPSQVLAAVGATGYVTTPVSIAAPPIAAPTA